MRVCTVSSLLPKKVTANQLGTYFADKNAANNAGNTDEGAAANVEQLRY